MSADPADDPPIEVALAPPANQPPPETAPQIEPASADDNESPGGAEEGTSAVTHDGAWCGPGRVIRHRPITPSETRPLLPCTLTLLAWRLSTH